MSLITRCRPMILVFAIMLSGNALAQRKSDGFSWPDSKRAAVSLSFDDARLSQVDLGIALLNQYGIKATFFVVPSRVEQRLEGWRKAVSTGREIGNHSLNHPCTGNFPWARQKALEEYTSEKMRFELRKAGRRIEELLGVKAETFANPCG